MMDNPEYPGLIDFVFQPKDKEIEPGYLNILTCSMNSGDDLFADTAVETLGNPLVVNIARMRDALKGSNFEPELKDGAINGINIRINTDDSKIASLGRIIDESWNNIKELNLSEGIKFVMSRIDYELMASTMLQFVSRDVIKMFMCGYNIDFSKGEDFINFVATDGRKLAICKFPCKHPKMNNEGDGNFIFKPLHFFIPECPYSRVQFLVTERAALIRIKTEDYSIDCWAKPIEGQFPNYIRVTPNKEQNKEWMNLNARSVRNAFDSIKGVINNDRYSSVRNPVFFDAEDPKHVKLTAPGASVDVDGEASRPMCLWVNWDHINPGFFDTPYTKFFLKNVKAAILTEETRAVRGTTMTLIKVIMPLDREENADEWGIVHLRRGKPANTDAPEELESENAEDVDNAIEYGASLNGED
jgi:hypothetical protein